VVNQFSGYAVNRQQELVLKNPVACSLVLRTDEKASPFPIEFPPSRIRENHGRFNLPFRHGPVPSEKAVFHLGANDLKAMPFVKVDRPHRIRPGSDQHGARRQLPQMRQQLRSNSPLLVAGGDVRVPNQSHILDLLKAHHAYQLSSLLISPERDAVIDFVAQLVPGHVWFRPAIFSDDAFIGARAVVDDSPNQIKVAVIATTDHASLGRKYNEGDCRLALAALGLFE
jgi:hypothetical protein